MRRISVPASQKQREFLAALFEQDYDEVGFGGARGGGKTAISACAAILISWMFPGANTILVRRGLASVKRNYEDEINKWLRVMDIREAVRYARSEALYRFDNGSTIYYGFCDSERDFEAYQGIPFTAMGFEELTQMTEYAFVSMVGSNRSNVVGGRAFRWATFNPGGPGHAWVKKRFVDAGTRRQRTHFVQAKVVDNPAMLVYDGDYIQKTLAGLPLWRRKQWLDGDWNAMSGQFWNTPHEAIREVEVPPWAMCFGGVDWGRARPFAVVYVWYWTEWMRNPDTMEHDPIDRLHVSRVIYQRDLELDQQAELVNDYEAANGLEGKVLYYADPATGQRAEGAKVVTGETIRKVWAECGFHCHPARTRARVAGWQVIKRHLRNGTLTFDPEGAAPLLMEMANHVYEGAPGPIKSEDMQQGTDVMDDATDALRYCIVSITGLRAAEQPVDFYTAQRAMKTARLLEVA
jgi:phage terminase large subunit